MEKKFEILIDEKFVREAVKSSLNSASKQIATAIGISSWSLSDYIKENKELQEIVKREVKIKLKDNKFMKELIKEIVTFKGSQ